MASEAESFQTVKHKVGDLVWAKVSGHPWWPCIVSRDTSDGNIFVKAVGTTRQKRMYFVEFFGPSTEYAWVSEGSLIEYCGIEAFKTYAQDQVDQAPTKSQKEKLAERFQLKVALTRRDHWEQAVEEADESLEKKKSTLDANDENNADYDSDGENCNFCSVFIHSGRNRFNFAFFFKVSPPIKQQSNNSVANLSTESSSSSSNVNISSNNNNNINNKTAKRKVCLTFF
jgi:hypothetical protein